MDYIPTDQLVVTGAPAVLAKGDVFFRLEGADERYVTLRALCGAQRGVTIEVRSIKGFEVCPDGAREHAEREFYFLAAAARAAVAGESILDELYRGHARSAHARAIGALDALRREAVAS